jgi:hypothetical protein
MGRPRPVASCSQPIASLRHHEPALEKHQDRLVRECAEASPISTARTADKERSGSGDFVDAGFRTGSGALAVCTNAPYDFPTQLLKRGTN